MATVLDVDEKMPPVAAPVKEYATKVTRSFPPKKTPKKWVDPKFAVAVEVINDLNEIYTEQAEYIESKATRKAQSGPDRMIAGYLAASANAANPIEFLLDRIQGMAYALGELRACISEIMTEEQNRKIKAGEKD